MAALYLHLTDAGLAAVQGASGTDPVTIAELGLTATPFTAAPTLTALPGEFKRIAAVAGQSVAANVTHMSAYDTSSDVWNATGLGLWLADGTLFAVYSAASTIISKAAPAFALIAFDIAFNSDIAGSIAFGDPIFTNPPATSDTRGLIELATTAEAQAGTDAARAITPATGKASIFDWIGYTPLDAAAYIAADVLAKILTVDGAGSGLDADLLDGQDGSWYANVPARLGYTPLNATAYTAADVLAKILTVDGAGSGLDADLLDGYDASSFARVVSATLAANGHVKLRIAGVDFLFQWKSFSIGSDETAFFAYEQAYTSWSRAWCSGSQNLQQYQNPPAIVTGSESITGCSVVNGYESTLAFTLFSIGV